METISNFVHSNALAISSTILIVAYIFIAWEKISLGGGGGLEIGDIGFTQMAIDETKGKRRILNGQLILQEQYVQFTNIIKNSVALNPDLACTEEEWQTAVTMSTAGVCYKYVIDDEAGTIRLPKYPSYFIGGVNNIAPVVGKGVNIGLEIGSASTSSGITDYGLCWNTNNALWMVQNKQNTPLGESVGAGTPSITNQSSLGLSTDPTKSGIEAQIKQEQIKGTYFIQVATGAETEDNIINEIELNNPFSLLDYKFSEYELNNLSWLRSEGQYNAKAVYPAVYELLLKIYNGTETKAGVSVKLTTETFTDYDFVLNTSEETFRLPIKVKLASGKAVVGNGMTLGLTNGTQFGGIYQDSFYVKNAQGVYGNTVGFSISSPSALSDGKSLGITTDPSKSGLELSDSDLYLYFYVGETVQNANLINAGRIEETLATKTDKVQASLASMPSDRYIDLNLGATETIYTAPANGWVVINKTSTGASQFLEIASMTGGVASKVFSVASGQNFQISIPVRKGVRFMVAYSFGGTTHKFRFIYAEGEQ